MSALNATVLWEVWGLRANMFPPSLEVSESDRLGN